MHPIVSRNEAIRAGLFKYNTGKPCQRGHESLRYTSTGQCIECSARRTRSVTVELHEKRRAARAGYLSVSIEVHPEDLRTVLDFVQALIDARNLMRS